MTTLVAGASGATGRLLVKQLLEMDSNVKLIVRSADRLSDELRRDERVTVIEASILDIDDNMMAKYVEDCDAVASCLGHNMSWKGIYGKPRKLVKDSVELLCRAIKMNKKEKPVKFILMNTTGNRNRDLKEPVSASQRAVVGLLRLVLPPHVDNEKAADYLRTEIGHEDRSIEWVAVRPDSLVNEDRVSDYEVFPSPTRSAIFDAGKSSRINVGNFIARLITDSDLWEKWKGQMPVLYNKEQ